MVFNLNLKKIDYIDYFFTYFLLTPTVYSFFLSAVKRVKVTVYFSICFSDCCPT